MTLPVSIEDQRFGEAGFRTHAQLGLLREPPSRDAPALVASGPSDFDLDPERDQELLRLRPLRPAAVLVPVVLRPELTVLLTARAEHLPSHGGQIAFPGGKPEPADASPFATALRETGEEIGLGAAFVEFLGYLDCYRTGTGYRIVPAVAAVRPGFSLRADPREVSEIFEVPLAFLMEEANHHHHMRFLAGRERHFYAMPYGSRFIWGATAGILRNLYTRLYSQ